MQKQNVKIGNEYVARIDGKVLVVQIEAEHKSGGWIAKDLETQKPLRINNVRKLIRSAHPAETASAAKQSSPPQTDKKLSAQFAYENWRRNNNINGLIIFETSDKHLLFGDNAQIAAFALKREKEIFKSSFTFEKKRFLEKVLQFEDAEVSGVMSNLGNSGNHVFLAIQKKDGDKKLQQFEIVKHVLAGHTDIQPGLPPFSSIKATPEIVKKRNGQDSRFIRVARGLFLLANKPVAKQAAKPEPKKTPAPAKKVKVTKTYIKKPSPKTTKKTPKKKK